MGQLLVLDPPLGMSMSRPANSERRGLSERCQGLTRQSPIPPHAATAELSTSTRRHPRWATAVPISCELPDYASPSRLAEPPALTVQLVVPSLGSQSAIEPKARSLKGDSPTVLLQPGCPGCGSEWLWPAASGSRTLLTDPTGES